MPYTDDTQMPWGAHKGKRMENVPDDYLLWLYESNRAHGELKTYIEDNIEAIKLNITNKRK